MTKFIFVTMIALSLFAAGPAAAHAMLTHAQPAVGSTLSSAPKTVTIDFSEGVVPRFSGIAIRDASGKSVKTGKPASGSSAKSLTVAVEQVLGPGAYTVTWHAVSVDTHRTQGTFSFKVAP